MDLKSINLKLKREATARNACEKGFVNWTDDSSWPQLAKRYKYFLDFCIENDWPSLDFFRYETDKNELRKCGIFIDEVVSISDAQNGTYVFLGNCVGQIAFDNLKAAEIHLLHNSNITVKLSYASRAFIHTYHKAKATVSADETSKYKTYEN